MITVLGGSGFIGSHLVKRLEQLGLDYLAPHRDEPLGSTELGHVIYAIGLSADFRSKPLETVTAHVCKLLAVLRDTKFDSLLYLSSTRIYRSDLPVAREDDPVQVEPRNPDYLYNISKLMGESLALASGKPTRVVRLSNVYGPDFASDNFLSAVIKDALRRQSVTLRTTADSERDYIQIDAAVDGLIKIATRGRRDVYNLASGINVTNRQLTEKIAALTGCQVRVAPDAVRVGFPQIDISRMRDEFDFQPPEILADMNELIELYRRHERRGIDQDRS